ncbi:MAG: hypothetical protein E7505_09150 [Ruminococcus sp.]|nr:hypothetical protein [Ruminococcus sp.]
MKKTIAYILTAAVFSAVMSSCTAKSDDSQKEKNAVTEKTLISTEEAETSIPENTSGTAMTSTDVSASEVSTDKTDSQTTSGSSISETAALKTTSAKTEAVSSQSSQAMTTLKTTQAPTTELPVSTAPETTTEEPQKMKGIVKINWLCDGASYTLDSDGELLLLSLKIKDGIQPGDYTVSIDSREESSGNASNAYVTYESVTKRRTEFGNGIISVGASSAQSEETYSGTYMFTNLINTSGASGDTVTLPVQLSNNRQGDIGVFSFVISYDASAFEFISLEKGSAINSLSSGGTLSVNNELIPE